MSLRNELIQTAAVAVSAIEDLDYGVADAERRLDVNSRRGQVSVVLDLVAQERFRQDDKWGPKHLDGATWLMILAEEVGEAADEIWETGDPSTRGQILAMMTLVGGQARLWLEENNLDGA